MARTANWREWGAAGSWTAYSPGVDLGLSIVVIFAVGGDAGPGISTSWLAKPVFWRGGG